MADTGRKTLVIIDEHTWMSPTLARQLEEYCMADVKITGASKQLYGNRHNLVIIDDLQEIETRIIQQLAPIRAPLMREKKPKAQWKSERSKFYQGPKK